MRKAFLFAVVVLFLSSFALVSAFYQVDGRVYYSNGTGEDLVEAGPGIPVLWHHEEWNFNDTTTTGLIYAYKWNSTSYFDFGHLDGNNSQWQNVWACDETDYGKIRYRFNESERCLAATIPRCHDIVINMSVLGEPVLDSDSDGICKFYDNCEGDSNPDQADFDNDGLGDVCDPYFCNGIAFNDIDVCSGNGVCDVNGACSDCSDGYTGANCEIAPAVTCFGLDFDDANVCSSNGMCVSQDECECFAGFGGENCFEEVEIPECDPADITGDGFVDDYDYDILVSLFGATVNCSYADMDGDGRVGLADFSILRGAFETGDGEVCVQRALSCAAAAPEIILENASLVEGDVSLVEEDKVDKKVSKKRSSKKKKNAKASAHNRLGIKRKVLSRKR
jgi:hypothetical protein